MAGRCRPPWLRAADGFPAPPPASPPGDILMIMKRIAAGPINQMDIGIGALPSVEIIGSTWMQQAIGDARRWDRTRQRIIENLHDRRAESQSRLSNAAGRAIAQ